MNIKHLLLLLLLPAVIACEKPDNPSVTPPPPPPSGETDPENPGGTETPGVPTSSGEYIVVGYDYADSGVLPNPELLTHINFSFAKIQDDFESLSIREKKIQRLQQIVGLKSQKPSLKVLLSIGGWGAGNFSEMAADETHRKNFCNNCLAAVNTYKLDGIDLDWEYPTSSAADISSSPNDTRNFSLLLKDLREVLGSGKLITMASEASAHYIDWSTALEYLDFVNIMSYDMGKPPYHNAALYKSPNSKNSCEEAVEKHFAKGVPYEKMTLGLAFFGRSDSKVFGKDELDYNKIISLSGYNKCWDDQAKVPYLTDGTGTMVVSFDDESSISLKAEFIKQKGLLGGMYWDIEGDDADWSLGKTVAASLLGWKDAEAQSKAFLATNSYVQKYMEEVDYGDSDYTYSKVIGYPGGGPSVNNEELPPTYTITWKAFNLGSQKLTVWEQDWSREYELAAGVGKQDITNLVPGTTYYWHVSSGSAFVASGKFETRGLLHQVYYAPNVRNGRDLGGWKGLGGKTLAYHKLYRGGAIHGSRCSKEGRQEMLAEGIRAEVDLRESSDVPSESPLGSQVAFYAPGFDSGYNHMIRDNKPKMRDTFMWVVARLRENKPVYFHCAAGRDRTATLALLLEGALGVSESDMAKDYELTYFTPADWGMSTEDGNPVYKHTRDNYSYGSIRKTIYSETQSGTYQERIVEYLLSIGVPQKDIDDLRAIMLR